MQIKIVRLFFFVAGIFCFYSVYAHSPLQPSGFLCEYTENPLGIDVLSPRFSWTFKAEKRNQFQSGYEIIVSDNLPDIMLEKGNVWASGKILSAQNSNIEFEGQKLLPFTRYY